MPLAAASSRSSALVCLKSSRTARARDLTLGSLVLPTASSPSCTSASPSCAARSRKRWSASGPPRPAPVSSGAREHPAAAAAATPSNAVTRVRMITSHRLARQPAVEQHAGCALKAGQGPAVVHLRLDQRGPGLGELVLALQHEEAGGVAALELVGLGLQALDVEVDGLLRRPDLLLRGFQGGVGLLDLEPHVLADVDDRQLGLLAGGAALLEGAARRAVAQRQRQRQDRKSTRLNSS